MTKTGILAIPLLCLPLTACQQGVSREEFDAMRAELTEVRDRVAIEDLMVEYYAHLGSGSSSDASEYFTEDAVFEVNGAQYNGREEIQAVYDQLEASHAEEEKIPPEDRAIDHMLLTNPIIHIDGDTATASAIWTGVMNAEKFEIPDFDEQGREYARLVRQDGKWKFAKRVIIADSAVPRGMMDTWQRQLDYDINAE